MLPGWNECAFCVTHFQPGPLSEAREAQEKVLGNGSVVKNPSAVQETQETQV